MASFREFRAFRPDLVFCHSTFSLIVLVVLRLAYPRARFIYCAHGWAGARDRSNRLGTATVRWLEGTLCGFAHRVVNVSKADFAHAEGYRYWGRQIVIENAVEAAPDDVETLPWGVDENTINLLFVGRFDHQKGLDILIDAFTKAKLKNHRLRLHLVGEAVVSEAPSLVTEGDAITSHGWVERSQIDQFYRSADLLVVPSRWEGLPLVVPEAYRNGTPVLGSNRSGLPDLVEEGKSGFTVNLTVEDLADRLACLDKVHLRAMRPYCLALYEQRFGLDRFSNELLGLYRELACRGPGTPEVGVAGNEAGS